MCCSQPAAAGTVYTPLVPRPVTAAPNWKQVRGALNILKNKDREHHYKIKRKLFMDFRMVTDYQVSDPSLDPHMDRAYEIAEIFESEKV